VSNKFSQVLLIAIASLAIVEKATMEQTIALPSLQVSYGLSIDIEGAKNLAAASIATAKKNNWKMAIAIVDTGGHLMYFEKMQDTQIGSIDLAIGKARTAVLFRTPTKVFHDRVTAGGEGLRLLSIKDVVPIDGGVPIVFNGKIVGAIGVSGGSGEQDRQVAEAGAKSVR
jgi:glc operon protein GlcG